MKLYAICRMMSFPVTLNDPKPGFQQGHSNYYLKTVNFRDTITTVRCLFSSLSFKDARGEPV